MDLLGLQRYSYLTIRYVSRYCLRICITIHFCQLKNLRNNIIFDIRRNTQILTLVKLDDFMYMYYTLPQFLSNLSKIFQLFAYIYKQSQKLYILRSAGFSKVSWSCSTLFQNRIYQEFSMGKGLLIKAEKLKEKICTKTYIFKIHI